MLQPFTAADSFASVRLDWNVRGAKKGAANISGPSKVLANHGKTKASRAQEGHVMPVVAVFPEKIASFSMDGNYECHGLLRPGLKTVFYFGALLLVWLKFRESTVNLMPLRPLSNDDMHFSCRKFPMNQRRHKEAIPVPRGIPP